MSLPGKQRTVYVEPKESPLEKEIQVLPETPSVPEKTPEPKKVPEKVPA